MAKITKVLHTGISVYDMDSSLKWYDENLGFKLADDSYIPVLKARVCFIEYMDYQIELFQYDDPKPLPEDRKTPNSDLQTVGTKHVAFQVDDMNSMKEKLVNNGVDIAHEVNMNGNKVMFIRDNNGVLIELIQNN